jgi:hypothetical protein
MAFVAFIILLMSQEETPQQAFAKLQAAITEPSAFAVRIIATEEAQKYDATVLLACMKPNKVRLELHQTITGQAMKSLAVSDGETLVSVSAPAPPSRTKSPDFLSKSWTVSRLGYLPSFWLAFEIGERTIEKEKQPDFSTTLEASELAFGIQKDGQRELKYTISYVESVANGKQIRHKYETVTSYDLKTHLPMKRSISDPGGKGREYREQYSDWILGDKVDTGLFVLPK